MTLCLSLILADNVIHMLISMFLLLNDGMMDYRIAGIVGKGKNWRKCTIQLLAKLILANCTCTVCDTPTSNHYRQVLRRMESEFILESVVRGYHVFQHIWNAVVTEELPCRVETGSPSDRFAVTVLKQDTVVSHVPRLFSAACVLF